jgi:hypothetical protein
LSNQPTWIFSTGLPGVSAYSAQAFVGTDQISDTQLKAICSAKIDANSVRGPKGAYVWAATQAGNASTGAAIVTKAPVIQNNSGNGTITVTVAPLSGALTPDDVTGIQAAISQFAQPQAITVLVQVAIPIPIVGTITVYCSSELGLSVSDLTTQIESSISALVTGLPIGGLAKPIAGCVSGLWGSDILGAITSVNPNIFAIDSTLNSTSGTLSDTVLVPAFPLLPSQNATVAFDASDVVIVVRMV